jgi:hypothetical protein
MGSKRQQTFAKMERERRVREKRVLKAEKKQAAAAERNAEPEDGLLQVDVAEDGEVSEVSEVSASPDP